MLHFRQSTIQTQEPQLTDLVHNPESHRQTRSARKHETAEDYVEAVADIQAQQQVCRVKDLAQRFAVSHVTVNRIVERLQNEGLLKTRPYQPIQLTPKGARLATKCRRRHETVFRFLLAMGVDEKTAAIDAEGIEHHVSAKTLKKFAEWTEKLSG